MLSVQKLINVIRDMKRFRFQFSSFLCNKGQCENYHSCNYNFSIDTSTKPVIKMLCKVNVFVINAWCILFISVAIFETTCVNIPNYDETKPIPPEEVITGLNAPHPGRHNYGRNVLTDESPESKLYHDTLP